MTNFYKTMPSPVGELTLIGNDHNLIAVLWEGDELTHIKKSNLKKDNNNHLLCQAGLQLQEYFNKKRKVFDLPLECFGTPFQMKVWQALRTIPYGTTMSYGELAAQISAPKASRAVGAANSKNLLSIIVPCHRVIGANGKLTGFAGGLSIKAYLLNLEKE